MRHTKIVVTLGPATATEAAIRALIDAGADVFRLNFSHGTHESHAELFGLVRQAATRSGRAVAILQDLSGPKIRTGPLAGDRPIELRAGDELRIATGSFAGSAGRISTPYAELARAIRPGDRLLLDDGRLELRVVASDGSEIATMVVHGGVLGSHKGINAPGVSLPVSAMTAKDADDLRFGLVLGVDLVALSFVQRAADLERAREVMAQAGIRLPLIAKIERPGAVDHLDEVLAACDGVMVARGDLGLEIPLEQVPRVQKEITRRARQAGLPVIVATQVLDSMRTEPRPTRAEVSDAANTVHDGVDAIMLSGETAVGAFPLRAVDTLNAVIADAERMPQVPVPPAGDLTKTGHGRALCEAAVTLAHSGQANAIIAVTRGGKTARALSSLRPRVRIYAATPNAPVANQLALYWGVAPLVCAVGPDVDSTRRTVEQSLLAARLLAPGAVVVFVSVHPDLARTDANFLNLQRLGA